MMGLIAKSLTQQSAHAARKSNLWDDLMERLNCCLFPAAVDEFERYVESLGLQIPRGWQELIDEEVEKHRIAIEDEDITRIMRDFDFR